MAKKNEKRPPKRKSAVKKEKSDSVAQKNQTKKLAEKEALALKRLQKGPWNIPDIAQEFDTSEEDAVGIIDSLYRRGYDIVHERDTKRVYLSSDPNQLTALRIDAGENGESKKEILRHTRKIGVIHGTVLGSKYSNPTLLYTVYKKFEEEGVDFVIHLGDVVTGRLVRKREGESFLPPDPEIQGDYVLRHFPKSKFFKTYMISGTRDLTFKSRKGFVINLVRRVCSDDSRPDMVYRGDLSATFYVRGVRIEAINPGDDYAPYSKSYPLQNIITGLISEEESFSTQDDESVVALVGGSHVYDRIKSGNIHGILVPSLQSQTPYQKGKRKRGSGPLLGACIIELDFDDNWKLKSEQGRSGIKVRLLKLKKYQRKNDYRAQISISKALSENATKVLGFLDAQPRTEGEISRAFKMHKDKVWSVIKELGDHGYKILTPEDAEQADTKQFALKHLPASHFKPLSLKDLFVERHKAGFCSDTHFGSQDQLYSLVSRFYEICEEEKVEAVFHCGDWSAGDFNHPANIFKVFIPGAEGQMRFLTDHYPRLKGDKKTVGVDGNHDTQHGSKKGMDVLKNLFMKNRADIVYLGHDVGVAKLGKLNIELLHPAGGAGYALSYKGQNIIESEIRLNRARRNKDKIHVLALGNWHVFNEQVHSEAIVICVPCFQQQTADYMKPKGLDPWIGGLICEFITDVDGYVTEFASEFMDMAHMAKTPDFPVMLLSEFINRYILLK